MELRPPVFLNGDAAMIIAKDLQVGATILAVAPGDTHQGKPVLGVAARIPGASGPHLLLCKDAHFSLLLPVEGPPGSIDSYLSDDGTFTGCAEVAVATGEGPGTVLRRIPADGNCLITSLFFMKHGRFPEPHETARLRWLVAFSLSDEQVTDALGAMRSDLIGHAVERPFEGGRFTGYGPLASALLCETDQDFMTRRGQNLETHRKLAVQAEAAGRTFLAHRHAGELAAAMARLAEAAKAKAGLGSIDPVRAGDLASAERALVDAYRHDLLYAVPPTFLGRDLVQDIAISLGDLSVPVGETTRGAIRYGKPVFAETEVINEEHCDGSDPHTLLFQDRSFKVLKMLNRSGRHKQADFYTTDDGSQGYRELSFPSESQPEPMTVPADGNSLIQAMFAFRDGRLPTADAIAGARASLNARLTDDEIQVLLENLRDDLTRHAPERPFEAGLFPGCGPRTSALLAADTEFMAKRGESGRGLPESKDEAALSGRTDKAGTKRGFQELEMKEEEKGGEPDEEERALALAIALSLQEETPSVSRGGGGSPRSSEVRQVKQSRGHRL
jgi:hypothetical protein